MPKEKRATHSKSHHAAHIDFTVVGEYGIHMNAVFASLIALTSIYLNNKKNHLPCGL